MREGISYAELMTGFIHRAIYWRQGFVKGGELCLNLDFFWLAVEVSRLPVKVLSPCQK